MLSRVHSHEERRNLMYMYISVVCHRSCLEVDSRMFAVMLAHMIYILFSNFEKGTCISINHCPFSHKYLHRSCLVFNCEIELFPLCHLSVIIWISGNLVTNTYNIFKLIYIFNY